MTTHELLKKARTYVVQGWCVGAPAKTLSGMICHAKHPDAVSWCALGALWAPLPDFNASILEATNSQRLITEACNILKALSGEEEIFDYNDAPGRTKEDILELLDQAIAIAERRNFNG